MPTPLPTAAVNGTNSTSRRALTDFSRYDAPPFRDAYGDWGAGNTPGSWPLNDGSWVACEELDGGGALTDAAGDACADYYSSPRELMARCGGDRDDDDFTAADMCCACGGGANNPARIWYPAKSSAYHNSSVDWASAFGRAVDAPTSANASVVLGVSLSDALRHGSNFRLAPGDRVTPSDLATFEPFALERRWYKLDALLDWDARTYDLALDDVLVVEGAPLGFDGRADAGVSRVGLYAWGVGEAYFDEIYVGPDHTTGFRCPVPKDDGVRFEAGRPPQRGWGADQLGGPSTEHEMMRHESHLTQREIFEVGNKPGLVSFEGDGLRAFNNEVHQRYADGDHPLVEGAMHAGALLHVPPSRATSGRRGGSGRGAGSHGALGAPSRDFTRAAATRASAENAWVFDHWDAVHAEPDDAGAGPARDADVYAHAQAEGYRAGEAGLSGSYVWYGEHYHRDGARAARAAAGDGAAPSWAADAGAAVPEYLRGGVVACSSDDLNVWKFEGVMLHYANLTDWVFGEAASPNGCCAANDGAHRASARRWSDDRQCDSSRCVSDLGLAAARPKVLYDEKRETYVMWMGVDDAVADDSADPWTRGRELSLAGVATSKHPNGPFSFRRALYPDGNRTRDQTVYASYAPGATRGADNGFGGAGGYGDGPGVRSDRGAVAYLGRTYFETTEYVLPAPQMQPLWESVKKWEGGPTDFGLSYHRAFYEREYDNLHDIYLQRWRQEDRPWQVLCVNRVTGEQREIPRDFQNVNNFETVLGSLCYDPYEYKVITGQGFSAGGEAVGIKSRFKDPTAPGNNAWMPSSVPGVKSQPWSANYEDGQCGIRALDDDYNLDDPDIPYRPELRLNRENCSNIADNPLHPAIADRLVGVERVVETRRAKQVAISSLTSDMLDTTGSLRSFEGELEDAQDMISLLAQYAQFDWDSGRTLGATYRPPVHAPGFGMERDWETRFQQYDINHNDRARYTPGCTLDGSCPVNFKAEMPGGGQLPVGIPQG